MNTVGKCMTLCPRKEFNFRKSHELIHTLEFTEGNVETYETVCIANIKKLLHLVLSEKPLIHFCVRSWRISSTLVLVHLVLKASWTEDSKGTFAVFDQAAICYYLSKGTGSPVKCLAQGHIKRTCWLIFTLSL